MPNKIIAALITVTAIGLTPLVAQAAKPGSKVMVEDHKHGTGGNDWHVQLEVNKQSTRLASVVVYSQRCGETAYMQRLPLNADGSFEVVDRALENGKGTWSVSGGFTFSDRATGTWGVTVGDCVDTGTFIAQDEQGHFQIGNPYEYAPPSVFGNSLNARKLRSLKYRTRQTAARFDTIPEIERKGYVLSTATGCPGLHHARKRGTIMWGRLLDPKTPQSLVFWCDAQENWTLAGYMYRASGEKRPSTFGNMLQWHRHGSSPTATWMTHVWLVSDLISSLATCAPFPAFEREGFFTFEPYAIDARVDAPCSDSDPSLSPAAG